MQMGALRRLLKHRKLQENQAEAQKDHAEIHCESYYFCRTHLKVDFISPFVAALLGLGFVKPMLAASFWLEFS